MASYFRLFAPGRKVKRYDEVSRNGSHFTVTELSYFADIPYIKLVGMPDRWFPATAFRIVG